ncbi:MAG: DDE-type integrase/transposase/recombinase, partial [Candidatus Omnitrophica bacterium]|nr:DDE-type integrase/transposase/recombinase [Candidatus Omnitrophota bacterium]
MFHDAQLKWATITKEAYAIYQSVRKLSHYLMAADVILRSDHKPLASFLAKNIENTLASRWAVEIEQYRIKFEYIEGVKNTLADAFSRLKRFDDDIKLVKKEPATVENVFDGETAFDPLPPLEINTIERITEQFEIIADPDCLGEPELQMPRTLDQLKQLQQEDPQIKDLIYKWDQVNLDRNFYIMEDGLLKRKLVSGAFEHHAVYLPHTLRDHAMHLAHEKGGHNGFCRTYEAIRRKYYWKGIKAHIHQHCKRCPVCAQHNSAVVKYNQGYFKAPVKPMEFIAMDLIGELPLSTQHNKYALTVICMLTGYVFCIPIPDKKADTVTEAYIREVYCKFGGSRKILTDNGTEFKNKLFTEVATKLGVERLVYSPPYRPQSNGRIEGFHKFLKACLGKHVSGPQDWESVVWKATSAYNFFPNQSSSVSPFFFMFGRDPLCPLQDIIELKTRYVGTEECLID